MSMRHERILITGAGGLVGTFLRPRLRKPGRVLRLLDVAPIPTAEAGEAVELMSGSITDPDVLIRACADVDAVIHLGGISRESSWDQIVEVNVHGTHALLEASREAGVARMLLASSNHVVGFWPAPEPGQGELPADIPPRPDTFYGVSKAAMEALGRLYQERFGIDVIVLRIGSCFESPVSLGRRALATWLSPDDAGRLFDACLCAPSPGYRVVWGVSDNTRRYFSLSEAEELGYESNDDAEQYADQLADLPPAPGDELVGGGFCLTELGRPNPM